MLNCSTFSYPFGSGKCGKEKKKLQKTEHLQNEKTFLDKNKIIFHSFKGLSFGEK